MTEAVKNLTEQDAPVCRPRAVLAANDEPPIMTVTWFIIDLASIAAGRRVDCHGPINTLHVYLILEIEPNQVSETGRLLKSIIRIGKS